MAIAEDKDISSGCVTIQWTKLIATAIAIGTIVFAAGRFIGAAADAHEMRKQMESHEIRITRLEAVLETEIKYIREDMNTIKQNVKYLREKAEVK